MSRHVLDFRAQAAQTLEFIESHLESGSNEAAKQFLIGKFKALYEQGVNAGKAYVRDGVFPYQPAGEDDRLY